MHRRCDNAEIPTKTPTKIANSGGREPVVSVPGWSCPDEEMQVSVMCSSVFDGIASGGPLDTK
jgi:hypothetical protein